MDKRINLITGTTRKGPVFDRTRTTKDLNSLLASDVHLVKWIQALRHTLIAVGIPHDLKGFQDTPWGKEQTKEMTLVR